MIRSVQEKKVCLESKEKGEYPDSLDEAKEKMNFFRSGGRSASCYHRNPQKQTNERNA